MNEGEDAPAVGCSANSAAGSRSAGSETGFPGAWPPAPAEHWMCASRSAGPPVSAAHQAAARSARHQVFTHLLRVSVARSLHKLVGDEHRRELRFRLTFCDGTSLKNMTAPGSLQVEAASLDVPVCHKSFRYLMSFHDGYTI